MKRDFDHPITGIDQKPLVEEGKPVTIKDVVIRALLEARDERQNPSGEDKAKRFQLALRCNKGGVQEITSEDVSLIKQTVGMMYMPLVVGQTFAWCDADMPKPKKEGDLA